MLDVTAKDQDGEVVFSEQRQYTVNDLYFKGGKQVPMAEWDVTATEHFDLGVKPIEPLNYTFLVPLSGSSETLNVTAVFNYLYSKEKTFRVQEVTRKVIIE